jgi:hypothetical protein
LFEARQKYFEPVVGICHGGHGGKAEVRSEMQEDVGFEM